MDRLSDLAILARLMHAIYTGLRAFLNVRTVVIASDHELRKQFDPGRGFFHRDVISLVGGFHQRRIASKS
jgi:hypothetical protein